VQASNVTWFGQPAHAEALPASSASGPPASPSTVTACSTTQLRSTVSNKMVPGQLALAFSGIAPLIGRVL
jgi:hypothetical protein